MTRSNLTEVSRREFLVLGASALAATNRPAAAAAILPSRGVNIPGWLDRAGGAAPAQAVLERLFEFGFRTVRLPIDGAVTLSDENGLSCIHAALARLVSFGFSVLADLHPGQDLHRLLREDPTAGDAHLVRVWTALRAVIADLPPDKVFPELLNEPPMSIVRWLPLRDRLAGIVHHACPKHAIVWGPAPDQGIWQLEASPPLSEGPQIAAIHFYAPMAFTHQGQSWGTSPYARFRNLPFPAGRQMPQMVEQVGTLRASGDAEALAVLEAQLATDWTDDAIRTEFSQAADWSRRTGCPVMLNEFGVLGAYVDAASRAGWVRSVRMAAEENGIGWIYWELDQGFGFLRDRSHITRVDTGVLHALLEKAE